MHLTFLLCIVTIVMALEDVLPKTRSQGAEVIVAAP